MEALQEYSGQNVILSPETGWNGPGEDMVGTRYTGSCLIGSCWTVNQPNETDVTLGRLLSFLAVSLIVVSASRTWQRHPLVKLIWFIAMDCIQCYGGEPMSHFLGIAATWCLSEE